MVILKNKRDHLSIEFRVDIKDLMMFFFNLAFEFCQINSSYIKDEKFPIPTTLIANYVLTFSCVGNFIKK